MKEECDESRWVKEERYLSFHDIVADRARFPFSR